MRNLIISALFLFLLVGQASAVGDFEVTTTANISNTSHYNNSYMIVSNSTGVHSFIFATETPVNVRVSTNTEPVMQYWSGKKNWSSSSTKDWDISHNGTHLNLTANLSYSANNSVDYIVVDFDPKDARLNMGSYGGETEIAPDLEYIRRITGRGLPWYWYQSQDIVANQNGTSAVNLKANGTYVILRLYAWDNLSIKTLNWTTIRDNATAYDTMVSSFQRQIERIGGVSSINAVSISEEEPYQGYNHPGSENGCYSNCYYDDYINVTNRLYNSTKALYPNLPVYQAYYNNFISESNKTLILRDGLVDDAGYVSESNMVQVMDEWKLEQDNYSLYTVLWAGVHSNSVPFGAWLPNYTANMTYLAHSKGINNVSYFSAQTNNSFKSYPEYPLFNDFPYNYSAPANAHEGTGAVYWKEVLIKMFELYGVNNLTKLNIYFESPTPANNSVITTNSIPINLSVLQDAYTTITLDFDKTLKLWLRQDDAGSNATDSSSYENSCTYMGGAAHVSINPRRGNATSFDGSGDNITCPSINVTNNFTVIGWFNFTGSNSSSSRYLLSKTVSNLSNFMEYGIYFTPNTTEVNNSAITFAVNGAGRTSTNASLKNNTWYHFAVTYSNSSGSQIYINGAVNGSSSSYKSDIVHSNATTKFGMSGSGTIGWIGLLDDAKIHNRVLSPEEIYADWAGTDGLTTTISNLSDGSHNATAYVQNVAGDTAQTETRYWTISPTPVCYPYYCQVYNTTTVQANNLTENTTTSTSYVQLSTVTIPTNVSGNFNISFEIKQWAEGIGYGQIYKNNVAFGVEQTTSDGVFVIKGELFEGSLNTTDLLEVRGRSSTGAATVYVKNVNLKYDYVPAPSILSPLNNSAPLSRIVNITTNAIDDIQYQVSPVSNFSTLLFNTTTANNYSGNLTLPVGLNYIRARQYNITENSATNWSAISIIATSSGTQVLGINGSYSNTTYDRGTNDILAGHFYHSFAVGSSLSEFRNTTVGGTCSWSISSGGRLYIPNNTTSDLCVLTYMQNYTNAEVRYKGYVYSSDTSTYQSNAILRYTNSTSYERLNIRRAQAFVAISERLSGTYTTINASLFDPGFSTGYWFNMRFQTYGTNLRGAWQNGTVYSTVWNNSVSSTNLTSGEIGVESDRAEQYFDDLWIVPLDGSGNTISSGNYTQNFNLPQHGYASAYQFFGNSSQGLRIYVNSSSDNSTWSDEALISTNPENNTLIEIPLVHKKRYVRIRFDINSSIDVSSNVSSSSNLLYNHNNSLNGYVKYSNGTGISGATVGYYQHWITTNATGAYNFTDIPSGNIAITAGMNGYNSSGDVLTFTGDDVLTRNFTLVPRSMNTSNPFMQEVYNISMQMINSGNLTGHVNLTQLDSRFNFTYDSYETQEEFMSSLLSGSYRYGINITPQYLERAIAFTEHTDWRMNTPDAMNSSHYDSLYAVHSDSEWIHFNHLISMERLQNDINSSLYARWNQTETDFKTINYSFNSYLGNDPYNTFGDDPYGGYINNYGTFQAYMEYLRYKRGNRQNTTWTDNIIWKYINQTDENGVFQHAEPGLSVLYNTLALNWVLELLDEGYYNASMQQNLTNAVNRTINFTKATEFQDGNPLQVGRNYNLFVDKPVHIWFLLTENSTNRGWNYRRADIAYRSITQYNSYCLFTCDYHAYQSPLHYYDPFSDVGNAGWYNIYKANVIGATFMMMGAERYDSSVVESLPAYSSFDVMNSTGLGVMNYENMSVYIPTKYKSSWGGDTDNMNFNASGIYPLRFFMTIKEQKNQTILQSPQITTLDQATNTFQKREGLNVLYFDSGNAYIEFDSSNFSNATYGLYQNSIYVNWTSLKINASSVLYPIDYINMSIVAGSNNSINVSYHIKSSAFSLTNYRLPFDLLYEDNRTIGVRTISNEDKNFDYTRGNESFSVRNLTCINCTAAFQNLDIQDGWIPFGHQKRTDILGNVSGTDFVIAFDLNMSTTNSYGFALNQPPGVIDYSPETPTTSIVNSSKQFSLSFSQNNVNVSWKINDIEVQQNNSIAGGTTVYHTNYTAPVGVYVVNATGCNAQGCATQLWDWTVTAEATEQQFTKVEFLWWD